MRGRSGGDARRHHRARRRPGPGQPAAAGRTGHRPLGAGRSLRHRQRAGAERRPGVPPQSRALRVPALGPGRLPQLPRRAARDRHRAPGEHRVPGPRGLRGRRRRVPRHLLRHRLAHHDGQRPGRGRLGRRRHRGRGGDARPAELDADSAGGRLPAVGPAARGRHRHRPRADHHRSAAQAQGGGEVRRVLRPRPAAPDHRRPRHARQHVPRVRRHRGDLPGRRADARLPAAHRPQRRSGGAGRGLCQGAGPVPHRRHARTPTYTETLELDLGDGGAEPGRSAAAAGPGRADRRQALVRRRARRAEEGREGRGLGRRHGGRPPRPSSNTARS